jgi:hypothetical protein
MKITLLGSNGLLSASLGIYNNLMDNALYVWGLDSPLRHKCNEFYKVNLTNEEIAVEKILDSDIIIYTCGAGIQSNRNEPFQDIYYLNTFFPIKLYKELELHNYKGKVITFGSYFEYGSNLEQKKLTERDILCSLNPVPNDYCVSKRLLTRFIDSNHVSYTKWHFILPTIYGEYESPHRLLPYIINSIKNNTKIVLTSGLQVRQYLYIDEIPAIINTAFKNNLVSGIYNIAGPDTYSVRDLTKSIFSFFKKNLNEEIFGGIEKSDESMKDLQLDGTKLYSTIKVKAKVSVIDVIQKYYDSSK